MGDVNLNLNSDASKVIQEWNELNTVGEKLNKTTEEFGEDSKKSFSDATKGSEAFGKSQKENATNQKKQVGIIQEINNNLKKLKQSRLEANNTDSIKKLNKQIDAEEQKLNKLIGTNKKVGISFKDIAKGALAFAGVTAALSLVKAGFTRVINVVGDYDQATSQLKAITGLDDKQFGSFNKAIKEVAGNTQKSAVDVAKAFQLIGSAQPELLKSADALAAVTDSSITLAKAGGLEVPAAADALTKSMNQYGAAASDAAKFTDILATSQQKGTATISQLSESFKNVGAVANAAGVDFEQTNVLLQAMAKGGLTGSEAGTGLKTALAKLASQSRDDLNPTLTNTTDIINTLANENLSLVDANKLVGEEGGKALLTLIAQKDVVNNLTGALNEQGNAQAQAAVATDNIKDKYEEFGNNIDNLILSIDDGSGGLGNFAKVGLDIVNGLFPLIEDGFDIMQEAFSDIGDALGELIDAFGFMDEAGNSTIGVADVISKSFEAMAIPMKAAINVIVAIIKGFALLIETGKQVYAFFKGEGFDTEALEESAQSFGDSILKIGDDAINGTKRLINGVADLQKASVAELRKIAEQAIADRDNATLKDIKQEIQRRKDAAQESEDIQIEAAEKQLEVQAGKNKKLSDAQKKAAEKRKKELEKIEADLLKTIEKIKDDSDAVDLDRLDGEERFARIRENAVAEVDALREFIDEKNAILTKETGEVHEITEQQIKQLENLRNAAREQELESVRKFQADKRLAQLTEEEKTIDISEEVNIAAVDDLERGDMSEVDFELFKQEQILEIQADFAQQRIDLLEEEIATKEAIYREDGSISAAEQNQLDALDLQKDNLGDFIDDAKAERDALAAERGKFSMAEFLGLTDAEFEELQEGLQEAGAAVIDGINQILEAQAEAAEIKIERLQEEEDAVRDELSTEIELAEAGFASNVAGKRAELDAVTAAKKKAQRDAADIAKKQLIVDTVVQSVGLITSSINIIKGFSSIAIVGLPLGIAAVAAMWAFFIDAKQKAFAATGAQAATGASGKGSTGRVHGKRHSQGGEDFTSHLEVEAGEDWGVLSRGASAKHGDKFHAIVEGLNAGKTPHDLVDDLLHGTGVYMKKGVDKTITKRGMTIKKQEIVMLANATNENMEKSMNSMDGNLATLLEHEQGKIEYVPTDGGRWEIDRANNKKTFVKYTGDGTKG